jgi:hypothetical protein
MAIADCRLTGLAIEDCGFGLRTVDWDWRLKIADSDCGLSIGIVDWGLPIGDCRVGIGDQQSPIGNPIGNRQC